MNRGNNRITLAIFLIIPAMLLMVLPFYKPGDLPYTLLLIGRFHPVLLHFPIVLIIVVLILELLRRMNVLKKSDHIVSILLLSAAISAVVAVASGFLLYASGDYSGILLEQHLLFGVITGAAILITAALFFLYRSTGKLYLFYVAGLIISNCAVAYTSHLGGSLTHGQDYLTEYLPLIVSNTNTEEVKPESEMTVYEDMIVPVFESKCMSCHNETRAKGDLSMTSFQHLLKEGESGNPAVVPRHPEKSELYNRLVLPEDHKDRMPPKGKTPLTKQETSLIRYWIQSGAKLKLRIENVRKDSSIDQLVKQILPDLKRYRRNQQIARLKYQKLNAALDTIARQLNITISRDSASEENYFSVAMKFPPAPFNNDHLHELVPFANAFSKMSLVSSGIEDDGLYYISKMVNLNALYLQKTNLNGSGLIYLQHLQKLEVLNLSYTKIDDKALFELLKIPNLRKVYLFRTRTSAAVLKALKEYRPSLEILMEEGPYL